MTNKEPRIWVFPGGGNITSYACGACKAVKDLGISPPDVIVAASGGAANAYFYAAGQIDLAYEIWANRISSKKILNGKRFWRMFDRDEMIDGVFMKDEPDKSKLDLDAVRKSPIDIYVGATNTRTGKVDFFLNKEKVDLLELLRATMTVPFFTGVFRDVSVGLKGDRYMDSRASSRQELLIEKALEFNPERIVVFGGSGGHRYRYGTHHLYDAWVVNRSVKNLSLEFARNHFEAIERQRTFKVPKGVKTVFLFPEVKPTIKPWDNSPGSLQALLKQGYEETMEKIKLREMR